MAKSMTLVDAVRTHTHWVRHCGIGRLYSPPSVRSQHENRLAAHQKLCLARMTRAFITISSDEVHASNLRENHDLLSPNLSRQYWAQQSAVRRHISRPRRHHHGEPQSYRVPLAKFLMASKKLWLFAGIEGLWGDLSVRILRSRSSTDISKLLKSS